MSPLHLTPNLQLRNNKSSFFVTGNLTLFFFFQVIQHCFFFLPVTLYDFFEGPFIRLLRSRHGQNCFLRLMCTVTSKKSSWSTILWFVGCVSFKKNVALRMTKEAICDGTTFTPLKMHFRQTKNVRSRLAGQKLRLDNSL